MRAGRINECAVGVLQPQRTGRGVGVERNLGPVRKLQDVPGRLFALAGPEAIGSLQVRRQRAKHAGQDVFGDLDDSSGPGGRERQRGADLVVAVDAAVAGQFTHDGRPEPEQIEDRVGVLVAVQTPEAAAAFLEYAGRRATRPAGRGPSRARRRRARPG